MQPVDASAPHPELKQRGIVRGGFTVQ